MSPYSHPLLVSVAGVHVLMVFQDCDCDEGCYYCMVQLRLKVKFSGAERKSFNVTSDMLEVIPSPRTVSGPSTMARSTASADND